VVALLHTPDLIGIERIAMNVLVSSLATIVLKRCVVMLSPLFEELNTPGCEAMAAVAFENAIVSLLSVRRYSAQYLPAVQSRGFAPAMLPNVSISEVCCT